MPVRAYTLVDVIGQLTDDISSTDISALSEPLVLTVGNVEPVPIADAPVVVAASNPKWDQGTWGTFQWS